MCQGLPVDLAEADLTLELQSFFGNGVRLNGLPHWTDVRRVTAMFTKLLTTTAMAIGLALSVPLIASAEDPVGDAANTVGGAADTATGAVSGAAKDAGNTTKDA